MVDEAHHDLTVIPNARLRGSISTTNRQIDVLIDCRLGEDVSRRVIVDAKRHRRPIDIKQVEEFEGMMKDVRAHRGILVCPNGHTAAALRRAQNAIDIRLIPLDELDSLDLSGWEPCSYSSCKGYVLWDSTPALEVGGLWQIFAASKCDQCRRFNIWCWGCGLRAALDDEAEFRCECEGPWFWLTAIEDDSEDEVESLLAVYLLLIHGTGLHAVIDRRPLQ